MIDMFKTRLMLRAMEQMLPVRTFLLVTFFGRTETSNSEYIDIDIVKGKRKLAPFVSPLKEGKVVERLGFETASYKPPYIKPKKITTANDVLSRLPGEAIYGGTTTPADRAAQMLAKDLAELDEMITRREEWMAAQILDTGAVHCVGDGIDQNVDFLMDATHKVTLSGANLWSATTSKPLDNLKTWKRLAAKDSGLVPNIIVLGSDAADAFLAHASVSNKLDYRRVDMGQIDPTALPNGATYIGFIKLDGLNCDLYTYEEYYTDENGVTQPMIPVNKVWMGNTNARLVKHYGAIQDLKSLVAVPRFPKSWEVEDPSARFVMVQSAPLPAMHQPDAFISAKVLA